MTRYSPKSTKKAAKKIVKKTATKKTATKKAAVKKKVVVTKRLPKKIADVARQTSKGLLQNFEELKSENMRLKDELARTRAALTVYKDKLIPELPPALARDNTGLNLTKVVDEGSPEGTAATVEFAVQAPALDMFPAPAAENTNPTRADDAEPPAAVEATASPRDVGPSDPTEEGDGGDDDDGDDDDSGDDDSGDDGGVEDMDSRSVA